MKSVECTIEVPMTNKEKHIIETLSKRSKIKSGEMVRMLLFETGILCELDSLHNK